MEDYITILVWIDLHLLTKLFIIFLKKLAYRFIYYFFEKTCLPIFFFYEFVKIM